MKLVVVGGVFLSQFNASQEEEEEGEEREKAK